MTSSRSDQRQAHDRGAPSKPPASVQQKRVKPQWNNLITMVGLSISALAAVLLLTFWLFSLIDSSFNPYADIVGFLILPAFEIMGIIMMPMGILLKSWRIHRRDPRQQLVFRFPRIKLGDPRQRRALLAVIGGTFLLLPIVGVSSYHGFHYSDSNEFCAYACHSVLEPQATTYQRSPHARVACVDCHIGEGATSYVKAKMSGTRELLATWKGSYPQPLPPAATRLRPARETCEQCHWPEKFFGVQLKETVHFAYDEENTRHRVKMLLHTGGGDDTVRRAEGIHKHMLYAGGIEFIATDDKLQEIPWVKWTDLTGKEFIYRSDGLPTSDPAPEGSLRQLDCLDCHNRAAHNFLPPDRAVDEALDVDKIDPTLPFIKREAVQALIGPYEDVAEAQAKIAQSLIGFYESNYPEIWETRRAEVLQAVDGVREVYSQNFFPRMKADWRTYPDNIGHLNSRGCFRCHDGLHLNQDGQAISHECDTCHRFLNSVLVSPPREGDQEIVEEGAFIHSLELDAVHSLVRCNQCHSGAVIPPATCRECHADVVEFQAGATALFEPFDIKADPMDGLVECSECHDTHNAAGARDLAIINGTCTDCHEDDAERFEGLLASWKSDLDELFAAAQARADAEATELLEALRESGPLHNYEASRVILQAIIDRTEDEPPASTSGTNQAP